MPNWKKVITSGSNASLNQITASAFQFVGSGTAELEVDGHITASGNISGSSTSTINVGGNITTLGTLSAEQITSTDDMTVTDDLTVGGNISGSGGFFVSSSGNTMINSDLTGSMATHLGAFSVNYGNATQLTGSLTADGSGYGDIVKFGGTTGMNPGGIVFLHTDGTWDVADATGGNAAAACSSSLLGVALGTNSDVDGVLLRGYVQGNSVSNNATGQKLYIIANANGRFAGTPPGTAGNIVRVVGYSLTGDAELYFNPSNDWIEIA